MHLITALGALVASLIPSILARSIPSNTRYRAASLGSRKSGLQEHPSILFLAVPDPISDYPDPLDDCMRTHDLSCLLEYNLQTRFLVKSLEMEALQQMLGVYFAFSPYAQTCLYFQPICAADHAWNPCQSEAGPPCVCATNLRRLAKQGKCSIPSSCSPNETTCGRIDGSADTFKCVGSETGPDNCGGCTVLSTVKGRYGSRAVGTDCAGVSHVDAVLRISDECAVQSCLARWSVDDNGPGRTEDQVPDTLSSAGQASQTTLSHEARLVLAYGLQQNTTAADDAKPHARGTPPSPDVHWSVKRNAPADNEEDRGAHIGPGHMHEDWTRIPDYRRTVA